MAGKPARCPREAEMVLGKSCSFCPPTPPFPAGYHGRAETEPFFLLRHIAPLPSA